MSDSERALERARTRADAFVAAGDWTGLHEALEPLEERAILSSAALSYRYGEALYHTGRMESLAGFAARYEGYARAAADAQGIMRALNLAGIAAFELGEIEAAEQAWDELLGLADGSGEDDMLARAANNLGAVADLRGKSNQAVAFYRLALALYQRLNQRRGLAQTYHNLGVSLRDLDRFSEAGSAFARAHETAEAIDYAPVITMTLVSRAELEIRRGEVRLAAELASRGLASARALGDPINQGTALRVRGVARTRAGQPREGLADLEEALAIAVDKRNVLLEAETSRDLGERSGVDKTEAVAWLDRALACFESLGAEAQAERIRARLADG